ncbi:hypothetical protein [Ruegeria profundi]|uniref:hypothetical protein n=1 Tax=Ruegeria profundi TaxID=1685378 RepID=UPI001CD4FEC8|nr:hypothetical protein [Ruegeria profundi]MCA0930517.1 hypothetical protein [Ruegeria profundi]
MKQNVFSDLEKVTEATFQKERKLLRPLLEAEARVQQQLARLEAQVRQSRKDSAASKGYRVTGTDVLWSSWESASRRQLNLELARIRAQKLTAMEALRTAFGRQQAVAKLSAAQKEVLKRARAKKSSVY